MYWKEQPPDVTAAREAAFPHTGEIKYEPGLVDHWSDMQEKYGSYFRLNIFGMGEYRHFMIERGMLDDEVESPPFPHEAGAESPEAENWRAYSHGGVMPTYKFCSNDGWVVTPDEITKSLQALEDWEKRQRDRLGQSWRDPLRDEEDGYWDKWIRFLYCARSHGGVEVF